MKIFNIILYILLFASCVLIRGGKEIGVKFDYVCIFPPYTSKKYIEREIEMYVTSRNHLRFFEPSSDDGLITRAAIHHQKLIYIKSEIRESASNYDAGCRRND